VNKTLTFPGFFSDGGGIYSRKSFIYVRPSYFGYYARPAYRSRGHGRTNTRDVRKIRRDFEKGQPRTIQRDPRENCCIDIYGVRVHLPSHILRHSLRARCVRARIVGHHATTIAARTHARARGLLINNNLGIHRDRPQAVVVY